MTSKGVAVKTCIADTSPRRAALITGISFIFSVLIVTLIDDFLLANFVVPGDTTALAREIAADPSIFLYAALGYLLVLALDAVIGIALFVVLRPANAKLALVTGLLRVLYAAMLAIGLTALVSQVIDVYGYDSIKLVGYALFALHIFVLGYAVATSGYIPKALGVFLMLASLTYLVFFVDLSLSAVIEVLIMLVMAAAEFAFCIWLIFRRDRLPETALHGGNNAIH